MTSSEDHQGSYADPAGDRHRPAAVRGVDPQTAPARRPAICSPPRSGPGSPQGFPSRRPAPEGRSPRTARPCGSHAPATPPPGTSWPPRTSTPGAQRAVRRIGVAVELLRIDREEVTYQHRVRLGSQELPPGGSGPARCRVDACPAQDLPDCARRDLVAQPSQPVQRARRTTDGRAWRAGRGQRRGGGPGSAAGVPPPGDDLFV